MSLTNCMDLIQQVTNCQVFIKQCDKLSRPIRQWKLKKTKSSKLSKLKEN